MFSHNEISQTFPAIICIKYAFKFEMAALSYMICAIIHGLVECNTINCHIWYAGVTGSI